LVAVLISTTEATSEQDTMKEMKHMSTSSLRVQQGKPSAIVCSMNTGNAINTTTYKWHEARKIMQQSASKCSQYTGYILLKGVSE